MPAPTDPTAETLTAMHVLLDRIDIAVHALFVAHNDPDGRVQQAQNDTLRSYGLVAQLRELTSNLHDQTLALAEITAMAYGRLLEHDKRAVAMFTSILTILQRTEAIVAAMDDPKGEIAAVAKTIIGMLHDEMDRQIVAIEDEAAKARQMIQVAQSKARGVIAHAADEAREKLGEEAAEAAAEP